MMKTFGLLALVATAKLASAHATVQAVWINDVDQGLGTAIRSPPSNSPITDVTSSDMTCNTNTKAASTSLKVKANDKITFEWHHNSRDASDDIIDPSHNGPVLVYIAPTTNSPSWTKLSEDGYDGHWAVERLRANGGKHSITLPDLVPGSYLLRAEIIALHEGYRTAGAQFYMECVQIEVTSSGTKTLPKGVSIPGAYSAADPGILFDLYNGFSSYQIPGPAVWDGVSGGGASPAPTTTKAAAPTTTTKAAAPITTTNAVVPTTLRTTVRSATTTTSASSSPVTTTTTPPASGGAVAEWQQCGGINYAGATVCQKGLTCKEWNPYYFQCIKE